ncbi:MAG: aspartate/glutamate racemase family protein [Pseudomonadota bacterium]
MHIGLIGGIGPAATNYYHLRLIASYAGDPDALELTIAHTNSPTLLRNLDRDDVTAQVAIYQRLTQRLADAGADFVAVTSIAGHFCIGPFKQVSPLPVIDLIDEVDRNLAGRAMKRVGILGTRRVMETGMYGLIGAVELVPPQGDVLEAVHQAYVDMAAAGAVTDAQVAVFDRACASMIEEQGVEAIMLGGTDLALVYNSETPTFPIVDCAAIHADAIAARSKSP